MSEIVERDKKKSKNEARSPEIVDDFLCDYPVIYRNGDFLVYGNNGYSKHTDAQVRRLLVRHVRERFSHGAGTAKMVGECLALLKDLTLCDVESLPFDLRQPEEIANLHKVNNGVLDCTPMLIGEPPTLLPTSKELVCIGGTNAGYDPAATCPKFDEFMGWFTCGDKAAENLLLEFLSLGLMRTMDLQRFLILVGNGSNGKSVFLSAIEFLFGSDNCSPVSFERMGGRFDLAAVTDKTFNISPDANEVSKVAEGILKQLVDRSRQTFERKHKDSFAARCFAQFIFAANVMPRWRDRTDGLWRRMLVFPCLAQVSGSDIVRDLENTFNYSGVLNRVVAAGRRLALRHDFEIPPVVTQAVEAERLNSNPALAFIRETIFHVPGEFMESRPAFSQYENWCEGHGYKSLNDGNFGKEIRAAFSAEIKAGLVVHGKSKKVEGVKRQNGYWGLVYDPDGREAWEQERERQVERARKLREEEEQKKVEEARDKERCEQFENMRPGRSSVASAADAKAKADAVAEVREMLGDVDGV